MRAFFLAFAVLVAILVFGAPAFAAAEPDMNCQTYRQSIVDLERAPNRAPSWRPLEMYLRQLYERDCISDPIAPRSPERWYTIDGDPASGPPPADTDLRSTRPTPLPAVRNAEQAPMGIGPSRSGISGSTR